MNSETTEKKVMGLQGRVAQILNARELVINIGASKGVTPGMKFAVMAEIALEVNDPETGEVLDVIDREKTRVVASEVREKITICRTYRSVTTPAGSAYTNLEASSQRLVELARSFQAPTTSVETLEAQDSQLPPPLSPEESYVKINDRVVSIQEE